METPKNKAVNWLHHARLLIALAMLAQLPTLAGTAANPMAESGRPTATFETDSLPYNGNIDVNAQLREFEAQLQPLLDSIQQMAQQLVGQLNEAELEQRLAPALRQLEEQAAAWEAKVETWAGQLDGQLSGPNWAAFEESMEQFGRQMEQLGGQLEQWGEELGRQFEHAFDNFDMSFDQKPTLDDKLLNVLKSELMRDGFINSPDDELKLTISKDRMKVNGKAVDSDTHQNYLDLVRMYGNGKAVDISQRNERQQIRIEVE